MRELVRVLVVQSNRLKPWDVYIYDTLTDMQQTVNGSIEYFEPWDDRVAIVCNDEGKINGMRPNRKVYSESGRLLDIIYGDFFIIGVDDEGGNVSLTDEQVNKYMTMFEDESSRVSYIDIIDITTGKVTL